MYTTSEEWYEEIWYDSAHKERVILEIKSRFHDYFQKFLDTDQGNAPDPDALAQLAQKFGSKSSRRKKPSEHKAALQGIIRSSVDAFEKDREKYLSILDADSLEEYADDPSYFKNTVLRNKCPIIHATLNNTAAKELDKFRAAFMRSDPQDMLDVVTNIVNFATEYCKKPPDVSVYSRIDSEEELGFSDLDTEEYGVYGVIGGGIRSHLLYRLHPDRFPYRGREAIWALWYLTGKQKLGSKEDSEFLMIDIDANITQQNYFYPYDLFAFYAFNILYLIKQEANRLGVRIPTKYRFVAVDSFLSFIARQYEDEIAELKRKVDDEHIH